MALQWDDSLILGIEEIDNQHKSIFKHFSRLSEAVQSGVSKELIEEIVFFIYEYAQVHFSAEERYMVEYGYPRIDEQCREHEEFSRDAVEFKNRLQQEGSINEIAIAVSGKMVRWIIQHIRNQDRDMVEFIKSRMA
jgi:hemerythrin